MKNPKSNLAGPNKIEVRSNALRDFYRSLEVSEKGLLKGSKPTPRERGRQLASELIEDINKRVMIK